MKQKIWTSLHFFSPFVAADGQVTFTGNVDLDFTSSALPNLPAKNALLVINDYNNVSCYSAMMAANHWVSGFDVSTVRLQYDYTTDIVYAGMQCKGICGDADGDGDPGYDSDPIDTAADHPDYGGTETFTFIFDSNPSSYFLSVPYNASARTKVSYFYPTFVIGAKSGATGLLGFNAYSFVDSNTNAYVSSSMSKQTAQYY